MLSQQSSFIGMRTALMCQAAIAATEVASLGPSKMPQPWMQAYSVPDRLTPTNRMAWPLPLTRWLPDTPIESGAVAGGPGAGGRGSRGADAANATTERPGPRPPVIQPAGSKAMGGPEPGGD